jgi:hypothetical protein
LEAFGSIPGGGVGGTPTRAPFSSNMYK